MQGNRTRKKKKKKKKIEFQVLTFLYYSFLRQNWLSGNNFQIRLVAKKKKKKKKKKIRSAKSFPEKASLKSWLK